MVGTLLIDLFFECLKDCVKVKKDTDDAIIMV